MQMRHALVLAGVDEPSADMTRGIASVLIPAGWNVSYPLGYDVGKPVGKYLREFDAVFACDTTPSAFTEHLSHCRRLIGVRMDLTARGIASVVVDDHAVGRAAAEHLIANGLRHFSGFALDRSPFATRRVEAVRETVLRAGYRWAEAFSLIPGRFELVDPWLHALPQPIGVFAACDEWGRYLVQRIRDIGLLVPEQIQVVAADNYTLACDVAATPLSSVAIPWRELGRRAGLLLLQTTRHRRPALVAVPPRGVVVRRSSDLLCVDDPLVAEALRVIRASAAKPLTVPNILARVSASRRELEKGFKRAIGRSMMKEVRRVHVEQAKRLLASPELAMPEVAKGSGFASAEKLSLNFRKETGTTPSAYRKSLFTPERG